MADLEREPIDPPAGDLPARRAPAALEIDDDPTRPSGPRRVYGGTVAPSAVESSVRGGDPLGRLIGRTLAGRYEINALIGSRAGGVAYRAVDRTWTAEAGGRGTVAVTLLDTAVARDGAAVERFGQAAGLVRDLGHPLFDAPYGFVQDAGVAFAVSEHRSGRTLDGLLGRVAGDGWPLRSVLPVGHRIADGLAHVHAAGLVHGALEPGSILLTADDQVVVLDLALRIAGPAGRADPRDDVLGLARIILALLTGGGSGSRGTPERPAGLRESAWTGLLQGLASDPALRPASAEALMVSLEDPGWFRRLVGRRSN